jgi:hypothetical protein
MDDSSAALRQHHKNPPKPFVSASWTAHFGNGKHRRDTYIHNISGNNG